ncbi:MAG: metallophosphoesterase [Ruminococcus sp.]|nr:metallophosphoesterase [Candidatus Copronaster equi]
MKKFITIVLTAAILFSTAAMGVCAKDNELKICVASDMHYCIPDNEIHNTDTLYGYQKYLNSVTDYSRASELMTTESGFIIDAFLNEFAENNDCNYLLVPGDMITNEFNGVKEHAVMVQKFKDFEEKSGKDIFVIDGNHDVGATISSQQFKEIYSDFGYDKAVSVDENSASYSADLGDKYRLIALDLCDGTYLTDGTITQSRLDWLQAQIAQAKSDNKYPIVMAHYSFLMHWTAHKILDGSILKSFNFAAAELIADAGVRVILTGHEHCNDATGYTTAAGNKIFEFITGALTQYPCGYKMMTFNDEEINYETKYVTSIDTQSLSSQVSGYSSEQLDLLSTDLTAYSKGYIKAFLDNKLHSVLNNGIFNYQGDNEIRKILQLYVDGIKEVFDAPLYGDGGIQEQAKPYSIDIPDTQYKNCWDVVSELLAAHFAGDAAYEVKSPETQIIFHTMALVLKTKLYPYSDEMLAKAASAVLKPFEKEISPSEIRDFSFEIFGTYTPVEYLVVAAATPLLYAYANDEDGVNNLNGTIDGYSVEYTAPQYPFFEKLMKIINTIINYFRHFINF